MRIFNKKKTKVEWTEQTAPKKKQVQLEVQFELLLKGGSESYVSYNDARVCKNNFQKSLLVDTDSSKELIKEEIAEKLETLYEEICISIDNDESNFSNEFWYNKSKETTI